MRCDRLRGAVSAYRAIFRATHVVVIPDWSASGAGWAPSTGCLTLPSMKTLRACACVVGQPTWPRSGAWGKGAVVTNRETARTICREPGSPAH
jgi:hypothetical protein